MFRLLFQVLVSLFLCYSIVLMPVDGNQTENTNQDKGGDCYSNYNPPGTVTFPLGDEELDTDILEKPGVNEAKEKDTQSLQNFGNKCSDSLSGEPLDDSHTSCKGDPKIPREILYSSDSEATPTVQCKRCDLKVVPDGTAVILRCFECYDIPPPENEKHRTEKELLYLVYFLEIANYTSPPHTHKLLPDPEE